MTEPVIADTASDHDADVAAVQASSPTPNAPSTPTIPIF
jgi:hypothetical protein